MSQWVDCVALVVRSGKTLAPDLRAVTSQFEVAGVALLGFVLNGVRRGTSAYSGGYTYYSNDLASPTPPHPSRARRPAAAGCTAVR